MYINIPDDIIPLLNKLVLEANVSDEEHRKLSHLYALIERAQYETSNRKGRDQIRSQRRNVNGRFK